uniref:Uncharacterized protein n=1 Tax=Grammatophora oceanica TaxID=210454 RepID=A0A7S1VP26_9STRA|mmetsp:Transcript_52081/g.77777  ORF Transcript_52081/g.77777 Transcript_52081/m.77777 type:complete len:126 (+) Transcript_52081:282-659(+)
MLEEAKPMQVGNAAVDPQNNQPNSRTSKCNNQQIIIKCSSLLPIHPPTQQPTYHQVQQPAIYNTYGQPQGFSGHPPQPPNGNNAPNAASYPAIQNDPQAFNPTPGMVQHGTGGDNRVVSPPRYQH